MNSPENFQAIDITAVILQFSFIRHLLVDEATVAAPELALVAYGYD